MAGDPAVGLPPLTLKEVMDQNRDAGWTLRYAATYSDGHVRDWTQDYDLPVWKYSHPKRLSFPSRFRISQHGLMAFQEWQDIRFVEPDGTVSTIRRPGCQLLGLSPDGRYAALLVEGEERDNRLVVLERSSKRDLDIPHVRLLWSAHSVSWSPESSRLACATADGRVAIVDITGRTATVIAEGQRPSWSADGRRIAFLRGVNVTGKTSPVEVWLWEAASGKSERVARIDHIAGPVVLSPDGAYVIYVGDLLPGTSRFHFPIEPFGLRLLRLADGASVPIPGPVFPTYTGVAQYDLRWNFWWVRAEAPNDSKKGE